MPMKRHTISEDLSQWLRSGFDPVCREAGTGVDAVRVLPAARPEFGDYQCNAAMALAKKAGRQPREVAAAALEASGPHGAVSKAEVAGPGFINIHLDDAWLAGRLQEVEPDERLGVPAVGEGKNVVMDYGSPNITKPLHIGHLRSHNIGSVLDRIYRVLGYRVTADNHLGDWGTQFGITIRGFREFGDEEALKTRPMEELERVYVRSYERGKNDEQWMNECRAELVKLQSGEEANLELWKQFVRLSKEELERIYRRLGVRYDEVRGESYYHDRLGKVVNDLEERGLAKQSEGALVVFLEEEKLPPCIVRKSDRGFNYATTDIATLESRVEEFGPDLIVYVTDDRQQLHFRQIFAIARRIGYTVGLKHVGFGLMRLPEGTFSTREGNVIKLESLLDEAVDRALEVVRETSPDMNEEAQRQIAEAVGIGAVKYIDLSQNPQTTVTFTWEKALSLEGNSGPYLQYAYARIRSVGTKYRERFPGKKPEDYEIRLGEPVERALAVKLLRFGEAVIQAAENFKPSALTEYLYDVAQTYSTFYQNVPFLKAEEGTRESRVRLCNLTADVLSKGLDLLGISHPERI
jgi:arginyl-tRNA synthetase